MIFANCFVGIPIPEQVGKEVRRIQQQLLKLLPAWDIADTKIVHMTLYYLGSQKDADLEVVSDKIASHIEILRGEEITLGGLGYFTKEWPNVVFLSAEYSTRVDQFYRILTEELAEFRNEDADRDFCGHVTLGRLRTEESVRQFLANQEQLERLCSVKKLNFAIRELGIYVLQDEALAVEQKFWRRLEL